MRRFTRPSDTVLKFKYWTDRMKAIDILTGFGMKGIEKQRDEIRLILSFANDATTTEASKILQRPDVQFWFERLN